MMKKYNTLWSILDQLGIEVPPIQRDFAQGRETEHASKVRKSILDSICKALENNEQLSLEFVYGKIYGLKNEEELRKNKNTVQSLVNSVRDYALTIDLTLKDITVEDKSFEKSDLVYLIPLDGQQRLTTLFLLHWYIAKRLGNKEALQVLSRFRYKTRKSSTSFLKLLTDEQLFLNFEIDENIEEKDMKKRKLYNEITNLEYFSTSWLNDPTVKAMLIMIQDIHIRLQSHTQEKLKGYWISLTKKQLLWFDFLDLKDFNLSDELYVKMNARGKQLSSFENFKAWLFDSVKEKELINNSIWESYSRKFDVEWNDIFWNQKNDNIFDIDKAYFNFFKLLFLYDNLKIVKVNGTNFVKDAKELAIFDVVINDKFFDWENLCDDLFKSKIENYLQILSYCAEFRTEDKYLNDFFDFLFTIKGISPSWQYLIKNYPILSFISHKEKSLKDYSEEDFIQLNEYHRIIFNLLDNSIIDNQGLYQSAITEIDKLTADLKNLEYNINDWVANLKYSTKSVFTEQQILEEILKYRLFTDDEWKKLILEAEKVSYFERQLNFWFFRANISLLKDDFDIKLLSDFNRKENFKNTTIKINKLFDETGIYREGDFSENIFERALLSKTDYLLEENGYKCFGRNAGRDVSWKRLFFRDRNSQQTNDALLEVFDLEFSIIKDSFQYYIEYNISKNKIEDWRRAFVTNKDLFSYLGNYKYIRHITNHGWVIIKDGYKTYIGPHYELFSLAFFLKNLKGKIFSPFNEANYYPAAKNNLDDVSCAYLDWKTDNLHYALDIKFINKKYCLIFFSRNGIISTEIKNILTGLGFNTGSGNYIKDFILEENAIKEIQNLIKALAND